MRPLDEYAGAWAGWEQGPPADDPRGEHHGEPDPEWVALCEHVRALGLQVEVTVSDRLIDPPHAVRNISGRRALKALIVGPANGRALVEHPLGRFEPLGAAALQVREQLEGLMA